MKYRDEISAKAKEIGTHFDENVFVFFKILLPVIPFLLLYRLESFIVPDHLAIFLGPVLKFMQYWAGCALCYHWMVYCLTGRTPHSYIHVLAGNARFWTFFAIVALFRILIDFDKILFLALENNHSFIGHFNDLRYGIILAYIGIVYVVFRLSFVLPMLANGKKADWAKSWKATMADAYLIILSGLKAALPYLIAVALLPGAIRAIVGLVFEPGQEKIAMIFYMALYMPVELILVPILLIMGASTVAYYYRERIVLAEA